MWLSFQFWRARKRGEAAAAPPGTTHRGQLVSGICVGLALKQKHVI